MIWQQVYNPFNSMFWSTFSAAVPVVVLMGLLAFHVRAHLAAIIGLISGLAVAIWAFGMPAEMAALSAAYGAAFGLLPIGRYGSAKGQRSRGCASRLNPANATMESGVDKRPLSTNRVDTAIAGLAP